MGRPPTTVSRLVVVVVPALPSPRPGRDPRHHQRDTNAMTPTTPMTTHDDTRMRQAIDAASSVRRRTSPNPWVGCVIECADGRVFVGATEPPGGRHAEIVALHAARDAGADTRDASVFTTLEPCSHHGRTGPCAEALIEAGVARVVSALEDPDTNVAGGGHAMLRAAGVSVDVGCLADVAHEQLLPYLHHRRTGRPFVVSKMAASIDGRT
ncbi:MAG: bifunctional diaminohydroxyphosphoribosylaminopyrimidine deaminase/5-amino-6-(5-phosphoribosylamino)uracil reductase RibD, partial [Actinobacteria bacterium]|nr:bifunctional diaminohydroxyphosphoribosylaminopyrimidine deaminase/5-amino-6-(5-phosphoribosylamino)uracil reductase RibD [Actinomycetota bacterium]